MALKLKCIHTIPGVLRENGEVPASLLGERGFEISLWNFIGVVNGIPFLFFSFRSPNERFIREFPFIK